MSTQPEALRLADIIDSDYWADHALDPVATELRRLHAVNADLLEALTYAASAQSLRGHREAQRIARAAIAKATGVA